MSDEQNVAFGERFGALELGVLPLSNQRRLEDGSWGDVMDFDSQWMRANVGNRATGHARGRELGSLNASSPHPFS